MRNLNMGSNNNIQEMEDVKYNNNNNFFNMNFNFNNNNSNNNNDNNNNKEDNKMSGGNRKRRLSKLPTPVIIPPPPSPIISTSSSANTLINSVVNGCLSSPISPAKSDSFFDLPASPRTPHSPTKRFVLKPINAITAALQRTTITGKNKSILRFPKSPKSSSKTFNNNNNNINNTNNNINNINNYDNSSSSSNNNSSSNNTIITNNNSSKPYQKPPKSPKILHKKGSNNSIRKKLDSPTTSSSNLNISNTSLNLIQPAADDDNNSNKDINPNAQPTAPKPKLGIFNLRQPKSSASSTSKKALPIVPAELAERLRESYSSFNSNTENENELEKAAEENKMYSLTPSPRSSSSLSSATTIKPSLKPILIDVRNLALYENEHICESFNVNLPTLLIKRYRRGSMSNFSLDSFITTPEGRDKYFDIINNNVNNNNDENSNIDSNINSNININGMKLQHDIIVFDETMNENDKVSPGWTLLSVLERVMMSNNNNLLETPDSLSSMDDSNRGRVYWLKGGFEAFKLWDKKGEFTMSGLDVSLNNNNNNSSSSSGSNTATSPSISSCSSDNDKEGYLDSISNSSLDVENQGASLVRRDSLFSVNTERNSLRRKKSGKNPSDNNNNNTIVVPQQIDENQCNQEKSEEYNNNNNNNNYNNNDILKLRRPSNGLQYLFKSTSYSKNGEQLSICLTNQDLTPSILVTNLDSNRNNNNDNLDLDSPCTPPPISHPEVAFVVSTIVPDFLFLGPEITKEEEVEELESKGIRRILNMAFECEDNLGLNQKFEKYLKVSVKDLVEEDVENGLKLAVDFIDQAYNDSTPIYVHCKAGKSRSVTAVLAYLIKSRHWTLRHAYDYVMERRSGICPNIGFVAELMRVEEGVLGHKRANGAMTHVGFTRKDNMLDMESINPLGNIPRTAFF